MNSHNRRDFLKWGAAGAGMIPLGPVLPVEALEREEQMKHSEDHHQGVLLEPEHTAILARGIQELGNMTKGLRLQPLRSDTYPNPLTGLFYTEIPDPEQVRRDAEATLETNPMDSLDRVLVLLELYACNQSDIGTLVPDDMRFVGDAFNSKRMNGWIAVLGNTNTETLESHLNEKWQFRFFRSKNSAVGVYALLNMLVRYAHVYGRTRCGAGHDHFMDHQHPGEPLDLHGMTHFIDEHCPGLLVCSGELSDLELALSLATMRMGVPAIVPSNYPFPLGKVIQADRLEDIRNSAVLFPNIRRLLDVPEIPALPDFCDPSNRSREFDTSAVWGDTAESFYILRKGKVEKTGFEVIGVPGGPLGIVVTVEGEPLDAFDCRYIERTIVSSLSQVPGVKAAFTGDRLKVSLSKEAKLQPGRIGETLIAAALHEFPRLKMVHTAIIFDHEKLRARAESVVEEKNRREREAAETTEETMEMFYSCTGCSPFAPNHMCVLTPQRSPQCGRPYEMIKTGALYGFDDMTNIHHSIQHRHLNSFQVFPKGICLDPMKGEWSGANEQIQRLTFGRTRRVLLHTLQDNPHTGCGCFNLILFETDKPRKGIGIMDRAFKGACPDGRVWKDLHYALGGKQAPGFAGASYPYLVSKKFLQGDGGWKSVVWVSPNVAKTVDVIIPDTVMVG
ncbi:MAG: hypothetical protein Q8O92_01800 [Candidatus Latescibacter sp.]|nr:hypothetical protein [Candidatus Latescibacter sp.]